MDRKVTKQNWKSVLRDMEFYNMKSGFVDFVDEDTLKVFHSDPKIDGVSALSCTLLQVKFWYENWGKPYIYLSSVGSAYNYKTQMVHPVTIDGKVDTENATHIDECEEEWYVKLNEEDTESIIR